jgi:hypothetical protein
MSETDPQQFYRWEARYLKGAPQLSKALRKLVELGEEIPLNPDEEAQLTIEIYQHICPEIIRRRELEASWDQQPVVGADCPPKP